MDVDEIRNAIMRVIRTHSQAFKFIGSSQTKLLELGAITGIAEHYRSKGCTPRVVNPKGRRSFIVKTSTRGFPWNFSRIVVERDGILCELHMNLMVKGAWGVGTYCVDVGAVLPKSVPTEKPAQGWSPVENTALITFAEAKKLVVYPMLLAQFVGIVHEVKPEFLSGRAAIDPAHPSPTLIVLGHYSANSSEIVRSYPSRGISVVIAANYDFRLASVRSGRTSSPLEQEDEKV